MKSTAWFLRRSSSLLPPITSKATSRLFHATRKQEVLPIIAATSALLGYYSYRAWVRMDTDWEEYRWQLAQYEKNRGNESGQSPVTIAIDFGTCFAKIATTHPSLEVVINDEGSRSTFNGVVFDGAEPVALGKSALERFYFHAEDQPADVILPFTLLAGARGHAPDEVVQDVLSPILECALERIPKSHTNDSKQKVVTLPTAFMQSMGPYSSAFGEESIFVPEPVAAIWGAQQKSLIPMDAQKDSVFLVVDVGGWTTQVSLVQDDKVVGSTTLPWGGESMVQVVVEMIVSSTEKPLDDARSLALVQKEARACLASFAASTRVDVLVPYLFADPGQHNLETQLARDVFHKAVGKHTQDELMPSLASSNLLSPSMPSPRDLSSVWVSVVARVLEDAQKLPTDVEKILVVGGASKAKIVKESLESAVDSLVGPFSDKLLWPDMELSSELTVLGAAALPPSFTYSLDSGLVPRQ